MVRFTSRVPRKVHGGPGRSKEKLKFVQSVKVSSQCINDLGM